MRSRATPLFFDPPQDEIHKAVAAWYGDQDIHNWFGQHLTRLEPLDVRWYKQAESDNRAGLNWANILLECHGTSFVCSTVQDLEVDSRFRSREDKATQFAVLTKLSKRTYYRTDEKLKSDNCLHPETVDPILRKLFGIH